MSFQHLGLAPPLLRALAEAGYASPTPIQSQAIGPALAGRDIVGSAQTGTGKTAAFALPILQLLDDRVGDEPAIRALILSPTRELAAQIGDSFAAYGKHLDLWSTVIFGGVPEKPQIRELERGVDVLVATPGRLLDLQGRGLVDLSAVEIFVLDEADHMLDMGFLPDVRRVIAALPKKRQNLLFSATMPPEIRQLADRLLTDPVSVAVSPESTTAERVDQKIYFVDKADKRRLVRDLIESRNLHRTLVFSRTKHGANRIAQYLDKAGIRAAAIHGNKSQGARTRALEGFKSGSLSVLVATDIAARGIDIDDVSHVINFDLPNVPETYVHRVGRTARAGKQGVAISFCDREERADLAAIERLIGAHIERVEDHGYPPSEALPPLTSLTGERRTLAPSAGPRSPGASPGGRRGRGGRRGGGRRGGARGPRTPR